MKDTATPNSDPNAERKAWMGLLAKAPEGRARELLRVAMPTTNFTWLRAPEIGSAMVQGRAGGTGAPFNLGEMTITRCSLKLASGEVGHAYIQGRRKEDAEAAAIIDALMQTHMADDLRDRVLDPLSAEITEAKATRAAKAAATKVDFLTMVRGED